MTQHTHILGDGFYNWLATLSRKGKTPRGDVVTVEHLTPETAIVTLPDEAIIWGGNTPVPQGNNQYKLVAPAIVYVPSEGKAYVLHNPGNTVFIKKYNATVARLQAAEAIKDKLSLPFRTGDAFPETKRGDE